MKRFITALYKLKRCDAKSQNENNILFRNTKQKQSKYILKKKNRGKKGWNSNRLQNVTLLRLTFKRNLCSHIQINTPLSTAAYSTGIKTCQMVLI
jgi:hypothetical protein